MVLKRAGLGADFRGHIKHLGMEKNWQSHFFANFTQKKVF